MSFPFTSRHRLLHRGEFKKFFEGCEVKRLGSCVIYKAKTDVSHPRLGITIKTKTNSVHRNKVKRQIREFFRNHQHQLGSHDLNVVIPKGSHLRYPFSRTLRKNLENLYSV